VGDDRSPAATDVGTALEALGRLSLRDLSVESLLQTITELARAVTPGEPEASVTLVVKGVAATVASSGEMATELDERQYEHDTGPCLQSARSGEVVEIVDARTDPRWGDYGRRAAAIGSLSSLSIPLTIDPAGHASAALNIYARTPNAFDQAARAAAVSFGAYAAVATGNLHAYLELALASRATIDQAKGILMERHRLSADQAFQMLAERSMAANVKVREVAEHLVRTGEMPPARKSLR
jgi:GAF domain-containing protein